MSDGAFDPAKQGWVIRDDEPGFMVLVGPLWQRGSGEQISFGITVEPHHLNRRGVVHGGMLMTFADQALGLTSRETTGGLPQATIQLDTHFIGPAVAGEFIETKTRVVRRTRSLVFLEGQLLVGERVIASAKGIWKILGE